MSRKWTRERISLKAIEREHLLLNFPDDYKSVESKIKFKCLVCTHQWETSVRSYLNSKNGCPSCKAAVASRTHKGKKVSAATRSLIGKKASLRPGSLLGVTGENHPAWKGGYGRDKTQLSTQDYEWKNGVKKRCHYMCIITGEKKDLECHHLDGWNLFPHKRNDVSNGVLLHKSIHTMFHDANRYGNNTERQFAAFLFHVYQLEWDKIKIDLQQGNHQPSSPKSSSLDLIKKVLDEFREDVGEKVQRLEGEELNQ